MNAVRAALAVAVLLMGIWANTNPETLEDWLGEPTPISSVDIELVGLQEDEEWLVLRVEFPDRQFVQQKAESMFDPEGPASRYIEQMSGSDSVLHATLSDRIWLSLIHI